MTQSGISRTRAMRTDCGIESFFSMCRKFGVSWSKASEMQKAFIEELTRINFERETAKKSAVAQPIRGFFDTEISA